MSRWYRAYEGTVTDAKLGEAAMIAGCSRSVAIAAWHCILESCAAAQDGGRYETTARRVAVILCEPLEAISALFAAFAELGMVDGQTVCAWKARQFESDTSTERSRKHREKQRNVSATSQQRSATPPDTETDTDTDTEAAQPVAAREAAPPDDHADLKLTLRHAAGLEEADAPGLEDVSPILDLLAKGYSLSDRILPVLRRKRGAKAASWAYFVSAIVEAEQRAGGVSPSTTAKPVESVFVVEGSEAWAAVTRARGKPPLKTYVNGAAGAFVRKAEIEQLVAA